MYKSLAVGVSGRAGQSEQLTKAGHCRASWGAVGASAPVLRQAVRCLVACARPGLSSDCRPHREPLWALPSGAGGVLGCSRDDDMHTKVHAPGWLTDPCRKSAHGCLPGDWGHSSQQWAALQLPVVAALWGGQGSRRAGCMCNNATLAGPVSGRGCCSDSDLPLSDDP